jgi:hypothetical protein
MARDTIIQEKNSVATRADIRYHHCKISFHGNWLLTKIDIDLPYGFASYQARFVFTMYHCISMDIVPNSVHKGPEQSPVS